jgi:hypothetical protein
MLDSTCIDLLLLLHAGNYQLLQPGRRWKQSLELYYLQLISWLVHRVFIPSAVVSLWLFLLQYQAHVIVELIRPVMRTQHIGFSICCIIYYVQYRFN